MHSLLTHLGYLDPATGSIIVQAVVGAAAGVAIFGRRFIGRATTKVRNVFSRKGDREKSE